MPNDVELGDFGTALEQIEVLSCLVGWSRLSAVLFLGLQRLRLDGLAISAIQSERIPLCFSQCQMECLQR